MSKRKVSKEREKRNQRWSFGQDCADGGLGMIEAPAPEPEQLSREFLIDWAYGQVGMENDKVTREQVEKVVDDKAVNWSKVAHELAEMNKTLREKLVQVHSEILDLKGALRDEKARLTCQLEEAQRASVQFEELMHAALEDYGDAKRELKRALNLLRDFALAESTRIANGTSANPEQWKRRIVEYEALTRAQPKRRRNKK